MKILRTIGILALVAGLMLGGGASALAQGEPPAKRGFFGTVASVDRYVVTLTTAEGWTVVVTLPPAAKYLVPSKTTGPVERDAFETILDGHVDEDITAIIGKRVAVLATNVVGEPPAFSGEAVRLMLIPSSPSYAHRVGVVTAFTPGSITIAKGEVTRTFTIDEYTVYRPDTITYVDIVVGESYVTVVTKGDPKLGTAIAKAIVLHVEAGD